MYKNSWLVMYNFPKHNMQKSTKRISTIKIQK